MMKLLSIVFFFCIIWQKNHAATFVVKNKTNDTSIVNNNVDFHHSTQPSGITEHVFRIINTSALALKIKISKHAVLLNTISSGDKAQTYFCAGTVCYNPAVTSATVVILPGQQTDLRTYLTEASCVGETHVKYTLTNVADNSDTLGFHLKYNNVAQVRKNSSAEMVIWDAYPNPCSSVLSIELNSSAAKDVFVLLQNSNGTLLKKDLIRMGIAKQQFTMNCIEYDAGVYFLSFISGASIITKKIIITNTK